MKDPNPNDDDDSRPMSPTEFLRYCHRRPPRRVDLTYSEAQRPPWMPDVDGDAGAATKR